MKFSEEQITELMQYAAEQRVLEYKILKASVTVEDKDGLDRMSSNNYLDREAFLRIGKINALTQLLYKAGAISWEDLTEIQDEVFERFDIDNIREEIKNQRSLEK